MTTDTELFIEKLNELRMTPEELKLKQVEKHYGKFESIFQRNS
jgi:hypothetical protein